MKRTDSILANFYKQELSKIPSYQKGGGKKKKKAKQQVAIQYVNLEDEYDLDPFSKEGIEKARQLSLLNPQTRFICTAAGCSEIAVNAAEAYGHNFNRGHAWDLGNTNKVIATNPAYVGKIGKGVLADPVNYSAPKIMYTPGAIIGLNRINNTANGRAKSRDEADDSFDYANQTLYPKSRGYEHVGYMLDANTILHGTGKGSNHPAYYEIDSNLNDGVQLRNFATYQPVETIQDLDAEENVVKTSQPKKEASKKQVYTTNPIRRLIRLFGFKDGGQLIKGQVNIPGVTDFKPMTNASESTSSGTPNFSKNLQAQQQIAAAQKEAERNKITYVGPAKKKSAYEQEQAKKKTDQYFSNQNLPNAKYNQQTGQWEKRNTDRDWEGNAVTAKARAEDSHWEDIKGGLEAAGYITGAAELGNLAYKGIKSGLANSMESGLLSKIDKKLYPTRTYRASVPGGNTSGYAGSELANKVFNKGDWTTKDLTESFQYLAGKEGYNKPGLLTGQDMHLTEYKVPFWKKNVSFDKDVAALKKLQGADVNSNEYIIPNNRFLYPRKTTTIKAVPEHIKNMETKLPSGYTTNLYDKNSIPLSYSSTNYASAPYKYIEDQLNAVTGHRMPITYNFNQSLGFRQNTPISNWKQPQFPTNKGYGSFYQNGGGLIKAQNGVSTSVDTNFPIPYSHEFIDEYQQDYNNFYAPPRYYGYDDGFDKYIHAKKGKAPFNTVLQQDLGPTWEYNSDGVIDIRQKENFPADWQRKIDKGKATKEQFKYYPNYIQNKKIGTKQLDRLAHYISDKSKKNPSSLFFNNGGIIKDNRGQWAHPGKPTRISSPNITMQGVPYPVYAQANNGQSMMMYPGQDYSFPGAKYVDEFPIMQEGGIPFLSIPKEDPEMMYLDRFNTPLNKEETEQFNKWVAKESERQGRDIMMDKGAYDVQGFWKSGDYKKTDKDGHGTDTWKKPNHPTFSNQSKYHGVDGFYGGNWNPDGGYQPSKQSASIYGPSYYNRMFAEEPGRIEHLDASRFRSGVNAPSPLYYKQGGILPRAQNGKTLPPIYTDNPNDPKLRNFTDSTIMNLASMPIYKGTANIKSSGTYPDGRTSYGGTDVYNYYNSYPGFRRAYTRLNYPVAKNQNYNWGYFPKPVQPIIYKPKPQLDDIGQVVLPTRQSASRIPTTISVNERHVGAMPSIPKGNYMVGYFDENNQGVDRGFMTPEERDAFVGDLKKRDLSGVQPSIGNITQYDRRNPMHQTGGDISIPNLTTPVSLYKNGGTKIRIKAYGGPMVKYMAGKMTGPNIF